MKVRHTYIITLAIALAAGIALPSCSQKDQSNKEERNAIRSGNKNFEAKQYAEAVSDYDRALAANSSSEAAQYDKAMAQLFLDNGDTVAMKKAREALDNLAKSANDAGISERALYNLGNDANYIGDALKAAAQKEQGEGKSQMTQESTTYYKMAIERYKEILRRRPNNVMALQNLRITQLKLPPEESSKNQQKPKPQQQQQQQQQQKKQPQPQPKPQNNKQILQSMQNKENETRRNMQPVNARNTSTDKPW